MSKAPLPKVIPELEDLAEQVGAFIEYWGFKSIHGRIWTHLFLSADPLDAGELINRLKVSKALISMSISDLLEYEVIQEVGKGPKGTQVYRANPDLASVIFNVLRRRERKMLSQVGASFRLLRDLGSRDLQSSRLDPTKVNELGELIQASQLALESFISLEPSAELTERIEQLGRLARAGENE